MQGPDYIPGESHTRFSLELLEGISGRRLKSTQTTESGEFDLESATPGLYFLSLRLSAQTNLPGKEMVEQIAVAVEPGAPADQLDLDLGWTSCGLFYVDRSQCPQRDLQIQQLSGGILDPSGAAIANAKILVFGPGGALVERLKSDSAGNFTVPRSLVGTYRLVVSSTGFSPFNGTLHAQPAGNSSHLSLTVQLGVLGSCSAAGSR